MRVDFDDFRIPKSSEARVAFVCFLLMMVVAVLKLSGIIGVRYLLWYTGLCMTVIGLSGIVYLLKGKHS